MVVSLLRQISEAGGVQVFYFDLVVNLGGFLEMQAPPFLIVLLETKVIKLSPVFLGFSDKIFICVFVQVGKIFIFIHGLYLPTPEDQFQFRVFLRFLGLFLLSRESESVFLFFQRLSHLARAYSVSGSFPASIGLAAGSSDGCLFI